MQISGAEDRIGDWLIKATERFYRFTDEMLRLYQTYRAETLLVLALSVMIALWNMRSRKQYRVDRKAVLDGLFRLAVAAVAGCIWASVDKLQYLSKYIQPVLPVLLVLFAALFVREVGVYHKSWYKIVTALAKMLQLLLLGFLALGIARGLFWTTHMILVTLYALFWYLASSKRKSKDPGTYDVLSDQPVRDKNDLFPSRRKELERLDRLLDLQDTDEPFATALCSSWGEGKTSLILALQKEYEKKASFIFIQPMVMDTRDKLVDYFFGRLEELLNKKGVYTGKGSPFQAYMELILTFTGDKKAAVLPELAMLKEKDKSGEYRETKQRLEEDILNIGVRKEENSNGQKGRPFKLYVVVDDIDRLERKSQEEVLIFIKEVADFRGCGVIFLMDYRRTAKMTSNEYLEKFLQNRYDLDQIPFEEMVRFYWTEQKRTGKLKHALVQAAALSMADRTVQRTAGILLLAEQEIERQQRIMNEKRTHSNPLSDGLVRQAELKKEEISLRVLELKQMLANARKVKRLVRTCIEWLEFSDQLLEKHAGVNAAGNWTSLDLPEVVLQTALVKTFFEPAYADWVGLASTSEFIRNVSDPILKVIFDGYYSHSILNEQQQLQADARASFMDALVFNRTDHALFLEILKTSVDKAMDQIDSGQLELNPVPDTAIREYADLMGKYSSSADWPSRMDRFLDALIGCGCRFGQLLLPAEVMQGMQEEKLIGSSYIPRLLNESTRQPPQFESRREKTWGLDIVRKLKDAVAREMRKPAGTLLYLTILPDRRYTEESISSMTENWSGLKELMGAEMDGRGRLFQALGERDSAVLLTWLQRITEDLDGKYAGGPAKAQEAASYYTQQVRYLIGRLDELERLEQVMERSGLARQEFGTHYMVSRQEARRALQEMLGLQGAAVTANMCHSFARIIERFAYEGDPDPVTEADKSHLQQVWRTLEAARPVPDLTDEFWILWGMRLELNVLTVRGQEDAGGESASN